jgi:hypothetical protein
VSEVHCRQIAWVRKQGPLLHDAPALTALNVAANDLVCSAAHLTMAAFARTVTDCSPAGAVPGAV